MEKETVNEKNNKNLTEELLLSNIYHNKLYPPPIGKYNKDLNFDSSLNMSSLSPLLFKNKRIILGDGSFSKVQLYLHRASKIKFAVKKMNLSKIDKLLNHKNIVDNEVNIQGRIKHPNIISLYNFCKYKNNCYLILEYASKGTLFEIIRRKKGLTESIAFYYFIQTLNAIYFLHLHSIAHRDLKPENLLIDEKNILKLCDFGWAVKLNNDKRTTFCGTVEYMAPEMIKKQKYDETIDIWSLGILLYELVHSYSPFYSEDSDITTIGDNIIQKHLCFKKDLSDEYKDLIKKILIKDSSKRIKIEEIYQHPFMTKYINIIYLQINLKLNSNENIKKENDNINKGENKILYDNNINDNKNLGIIYKKNEKMKNKGYYYKKISNNIKKDVNCNNIIYNRKNPDSNNNYNNYENIINQENITRDTDLIFASIPSEPSPKIIPDSNYYKEIKKVSTYFNINKINKNPINDRNESILFSNTSRNIMNNIQKKDNLSRKIKNDNIISHVKSFSLGQKFENNTNIKDNKLKIIISINNTQNRNYINNNKFGKNNNLSAKNKRPLLKNLEENYIKNKNDLSIYNKSCSKKNSKNIKQTHLIEHKDLFNTNSNNNIIKFNKDNSYTNNNYIKTVNNIGCPYFSMINSNIYSNMIIHNNNQIKNKNKLIKNPKFKNGCSKYLRRIESDYYKRLHINNITLNNCNKEREIIDKKLKKINNINFSKSDTNSKSFMINKTIESNNKTRFNSSISLLKTSESNNDKNYFIPNLNQNFQITMTNHNIAHINNNKKKNCKSSDLNRKNKSVNNKRIVKISNVQKPIKDIIFEMNSKISEINKE